MLQRSTFWTLRRACSVRRTLWRCPQKYNITRPLVGLRLPTPVRGFSTSPSRLVVKPFLLADIGEGIRECDVIQWFVEPGARVEQFDKLCEVQSDKASVEITSRFDGVIKKLHYDAGDMAIVGKPLVDIDILSEISAENEALLKEVEDDAGEVPDGQDLGAGLDSDGSKPEEEEVLEGSTGYNGEETLSSAPKASPLATPTVRHLAKEVKVSLQDVTGTGVDGRILKSDVETFSRRRINTSTPSAGTEQQTETAVPLSAIQSQMFKTMTNSLSIPHFLFADSYDLSTLSRLRASINDHLSTSNEPVRKISHLAFIIKAMSLALAHFPLLNARIDTTTDPRKPRLIHRSQHNIGVAIDTPAGLVVPVIRSVQSLSVLAIATRLAHLSSLALASKLTAAHLSGGTITVSNIGSIGGMTVAPLLVEGQVTILGVGKIRCVPAFGEGGQVVKREEAVFSWSADHRVVDGGTMARMAGVMGKMLEDPGRLILELK